MDFEGISRRCVSVNFFFLFSVIHYEDGELSAPLSLRSSWKGRLNRLFSIRIIMQLTE